VWFHEYSLEVCALRLDWSKESTKSSAIRLFTG